MKIYGDVQSGNCYKLKLICALLNLEYEWIHVDILKGETRSEAFLALNPNGQIPVCVTDRDEILTESNSILYYLAANSHFWPDDRLLQTRVLQWQFFEQYNHEPSIAVARFIKLYQGMPDHRKDEYQQKIKSGKRVLAQMNQHLTEHQFFVGDSCTTADISLYAYTHVAEEGGFILADYPAILNWLERIQNLPGYCGMRD
ncbi:MAG: glutathione S-transferase family protein [Pseudomonadota bacterium]